MIKVGLTGGIGSGKSTVSRYLKNKGIAIIDADIISREIYNIYPELNEELRRNFGEKFFDEDNMLKRKELGNFIFKNNDKRILLESLTIPYIKKEIFLRMNLLEQQKCKLCILDAPTLVENNLHEKMDFNILLCCDRELQIERVMGRDNLSYVEVERRIGSQASLEEKKKKVQFIVDNSYDISHTYDRVEQILKELGEKL